MKKTLSGYGYGFQIIFFGYGYGDGYRIFHGFTNYCLISSQLKELFELGSKIGEKFRFLYIGSLNNPPTDKMF